MVTKRRGRGRGRRARSDGPKKLGRNGGIEGSDIDIDDDDEESGKSSDTAIPAKRAGEPSSPSPEDAGAQGSGVASPMRAPLGGVAKKTKRTSSKRVKKASPASQEEDEAEDSGDARGAPLPDGSADSGHDNKSAATKKRGKKRSPSPLQEEERPGKRTAGPDAEAVAASAPKRRRKKKKSKRSAEEEDRRKEEEKRTAEKARRKKKEKRSRRNKEEKKQSRRALNPLLELERNDNSEDTPSSPEIFQEDEHHGSEMSEDEPSNTSVPPEDGRARGEEQQGKEVAEQVDTGGTSPPHEKDTHIAHGEEKAVNQKDGDGTPPSSPKDKRSVDEEELPKDTLPPQEKNKDQEDEETAGAQAVNGNNAPSPSTKLRGSETEKKPAVDRSLWSYDDELKILNALVEHAQSHDGALPDSSHLLANLTFDKIDANEEKLTDKIRKLKARYQKMLSRGCPSDRLASRLFKLSEKLWGLVDEDERVEPTSRDFSALSNLYPHLAKEVKAYAEAHGSRDLIMAMVMTISDEKARDLDTKCKKLQIEAFKLELGQASLIKELLSALPSLTRVSF